MSGQGHLPSFADPGRYLTAESGLPDVRNGLLMHEHVAYSLRWHDIANPEGSGVVLASAIGAELSVILYTTDPGRIYGVDPDIPQNPGFDECMKMWETIDNDSPGKEITLPLAPWASSDYDRVGKSFSYDRARRREHGYWHSVSLNDWRPERCLVSELKGMGVERDSVEFSSGEHMATLRFS